MYQIPFPAISFCGESLIDESYEIFTSILQNNNATYPDWVQVCSKDRDYLGCKFPQIHWQKFELYGQHMFRHQVIWMEKYDIYEKLVMSPFGWCHTFNIVDEDQMFYPNSVAEYFQYQRVNISYKNPKNLNNTIKSPFFTSNKDAGLQVTIKTELEDEAIKCSQGVFGTGCNAIPRLMIVVHSSWELPSQQHRHLILKYDDLLKVSIEPKIKITDGTLLDLDVDEYEPKSEFAREEN